MPLGLIVGGWFASAAIGKLADLAKDLVVNVIHLYPTDIVNKLQQLVSNLQRIDAIIAELENLQLENYDIEKWLWELKNAAYSAEDVLTSFEYDKIWKSLDDRASRKLWSLDRLDKDPRFVQVPIKPYREFGAPIENGKALIKVLEKFEEVLTKAETFVPLLGVCSKGQRETMSECSQNTTSFLTALTVYGRRNEVIRLTGLLKSFEPYKSIITIVGMTGVGKTTLAQVVCNDINVKQHFDHVAWVCISNNFNLRRIMIEIIESASLPRTDGLPQDLRNVSSQDAIQKILVNGIKGKKCMIVLDDIQDVVMTSWEVLLVSFGFAEYGSKMLLTTENNKIARMVGTKEIIFLKCLQENDYEDLFKECIFRNNKVHDENFDVYGKEICQKLGGLPLAAVTVGAVLRTDMHAKWWKEILYHKLSIMEQEFCFLRYLRQSYDRLPSHIKQCFLYFSLFPEGHIFEKNTIIEMWIAEGFIQPIRERKLEDIGEDYFEELTNRSFLQKLEGTHTYIIHKLHYSAAEFLSARNYLKIEDVESPEEAKGIHCLGVSYTNIIKYKDILKNTKKLRSLIIICQEADSTTKEASSIIQEVLVKNKHLRVLVLGNFGLEPFADVIGKRKHIRYMEFTATTEEIKFPSSISRLYNLLFINIKGANSKSRGTLLRGSDMLVKLRHVNGFPNALARVSGIGGFSSLQGLSEFYVGTHYDRSIWQLGYLKQLQGHLAVYNLHLVPTKEHAQYALLKQKRGIESLELHWQNRSQRRAIDFDIIEALRPHKNLKSLAVMGYADNRFPRWFEESKLCTIKYIKLEKCYFWDVLPPFGSLPYLKYLHLEGLNSIEEVGLEFFGKEAVVFPSLERLVLYQMIKLKSWTEDTSGRVMFPQIKQLIIHDCPSFLQRVPNYLSNQPMEVCLTYHPIAHIHDSPSSFEPTLATSLSDPFQIYLDSVILLIEGFS